MNKPYKTYQGALPSIQVNVLVNLPKARHIIALKRIKGLIETGTPLTAYDDNTPGNKSMGCSWGLCSESVEAWPDAQDHIWPHDFENKLRVAPLHSKRPCPLNAYVDPHRGCFYTCRVFNPARGAQVPTKDEALALYDTAIASCTSPS